MGNVKVRWERRPNASPQGCIGNASEVSSALLAGHDGCCRLLASGYYYALISTWG
jgi:hypothetical protein